MVSFSTRARSEFDAVVIGAGFSGLYMLHRLRDELGLSVHAYETAAGVGGTWYWNRYPGARCDSESFVYCYSFDEDLLQQWEWSERYPAQPEILAYLQHVCERFALAEDISFRTRVTSARFDETNGTWSVSTNQGVTVTARYLIAGVGVLSAANIPRLPGVESFRGLSCHTARWPHEGVDFSGLRVGVIGTGASAIQAIPVIAREAAKLTVFQRTANYIVPARNGPVAPELVAARKADYATIWQRVRESPFGFDFGSLAKGALDVSDEQRQRELMALWEQGGF